MIKTEENKASLLVQLKKTPIVQIACEKEGIGRASYYRWRKDDPDFAEKADEALCTGKSLVNDLAESQLIKAIKDGNMTAIIYWLKNQHSDYKTRVELSGKLETVGKQLTPEQEASIEKALELASIIKASDNNLTPQKND
jgi:hypothetical protein